MIKNKPSFQYVHDTFLFHLTTLLFSVVAFSRSVSQVYRDSISSGRCSPQHCQGAGMLFMQHSFSGLFQPRCADSMTFYCLPTENKLYIHLPSIFLAACEFRKLIWTAVSMSRMYMFPHLSTQIEAAIQLCECLWTAAHDGETSRDGKREGEKTMLSDHRSLWTWRVWSLNLLNVLRRALAD